MYQQQKKTPFCALTMYLRSTGNKAPKYEYKADAKSLFTCSLTKKKYSLSQINDWYSTPEVQKFHNEGYRGKWFAKTQEIENPNKYDKSNLQMILSFIMIKPFKPQPNIDGMKPIAESVPRYKELLTLKKILNLKDKEIKDLKEINDEHQKLNGKLREEIDELEKLNKLMYEHP
jgi:hypothetical protein